MKKILLLSAFAVVAFAACKKKDVNQSTLHNYSAPTILLPSGEYYSIPVGGTLPETGATAYDSFYNEAADVVYDQSKLDNTIPGLYIVRATAKNRYGMASTRTLYVAVTDIDPTINLGGRYRRVETDDTVMLWKLANGLYRTNDVAGNGAGDTSLVPAFFVQTSATTIDIPVQGSKYGNFYGDNGVVDMVASDTIYQYILRNSAFSPVTRTFHKL